MASMTTGFLRNLTDDSHPLGDPGGSETAFILNGNLPQHSHSIAAHFHDMTHVHDMTHNHTQVDDGRHVHGFPVAVWTDVSRGGGTMMVTNAGGIGGTGNASGEGFTYFAGASGITIAAQGGHTHTISMHISNTGAASSSVTSTAPATSTGNSGGVASPAPFNKMPPYVGVTYLIKT